jgi:hypothetical protein
MGTLVVLLGCGERLPTDTEITAAIRQCGIPAGHVTLTLGKNRTFWVKGRQDVTYAQFMCVMQWAEAKDLKAPGLIAYRAD